MNQSMLRGLRIGQAIALCILAACLVLPARVLAGPTTTETPDAREQQGYAIGLKAYLFAYPLVIMDVTRELATNNDPGEKIGTGPTNQWVHMRTFPDASFKDVVRPNVDTLYSSLWADVSQAPLIISVPAAGNRYYILPMLDMWTDVFAVPGTRTTGNGAADFFISGPSWQGKVPAGMMHIKSPTPCFWIIGRTQTNGPGDYEAVHTFQDGLKAMLYSPSGKNDSLSQAAVNPEIDTETPPITQVAQMNAETFFGRFAELLKVNPPHPSDYPILQMMQRYLGFTVGESFDMDKLDPAVRKGLIRAVKDAPGFLLKYVKSFSPDSTGWQYAAIGGNYGVQYTLRAAIAMIGLGMNLPEDAVYPIAFIDGKGDPLQGGNRYRIHFDKNELPPVDAFWSLTVYGDDHFFVDNPLNRYALGDRDSLKYNGDGSLDIYIQSDSPGAGNGSNWLPAPQSGTFSVVGRLYAPKTVVLEKRWKMAPIEKVEE